MSTAASDDRSNLSELSSFSKTLNQESNRVNELLLDVEKKLEEMNLGVEAWVTIKEDRYTKEGDDGDSKWSADTQIGLSDWNGLPKLLVRTVHQEEIEDNYGEKQWEEGSRDNPLPLLQASRAVRLKAMASLGTLLDALLAEAKRVLAGIDKGKQAYKELVSE